MPHISNDDLATLTSIVLRVSARNLEPKIEVMRTSVHAEVSAELANLPTNWAFSHRDMSTVLESKGFKDCGPELSNVLRRLVKQKIIDKTATKSYYRVL